MFASHSQFQPKEISREIVKQREEERLRDYDYDTNNESFDVDAIMDKVEILVENLRKECYSKFAGSASLEGMESRLMNKFPDFERKLDHLKDEGIVMRNTISAHTWDINEIKAQLFNVNH